MRLTWSSCFATGILVLLVVAFGSTTSAEIHENSMNVEIFAGEQDPGPDRLDSETTFGFRYGWDYSRRVGMQFEFWRYDTDGDFTVGMSSGTFDLDLNGFELSVHGFLRPDSRMSILLFGGIGGVFGELDASVSGPLPIGFSNLQDDSFTAHAGAGLRIQLGEHVYLRPDARLRWIEKREDDETDSVLTLALGFNFGGY
jgi:hypothetical protein